jgi:hypothetical protein
MIAGHTWGVCEEVSVAGDGDASDADLRRGSHDVQGGVGGILPHALPGGGRRVRVRAPQPRRRPHRRAHLPCGRVTTIAGRLGSPLPRRQPRDAARSSSALVLRTGVDQSRRAPSALNRTFRSRSHVVHPLAVDGLHSSVNGHCSKIANSRPSEDIHVHLMFLCFRRWFWNF